MMAGEWNADRLGMYLESNSALAPNPPDARIIFRALRMPSFVFTPITAPPSSRSSASTGVEKRTSIFFSRSTAAKRKSVMVLSSFHECERCALWPKANSPI